MNVFVIIFNMLRMVMDSGLLISIRELVAEVNKIEDLDGDGKFDEVWDRLLRDSNLQDKLKETAVHVINLAIEVAVAVVRRG